ncbi:MAG: hypothetical protein KDA61_07290, partial [Planctomycetales bacterium]|nr:hypothetical protein [Planctomycetales bacterium]
PSDGTFSLSDDGAGSPMYNAAWHGNQTIDLSDILEANNISFLMGATLVSVNLDNTLAVTSESGTYSFIAKKDFDVTTVPGTESNVPEPAAASLAALIGLGLAGTRRRLR